LLAAFRFADSKSAIWRRVKRGAEVWNEEGEGTVEVIMKVKGGGELTRMEHDDRVK
jgi:hypothetical protein